MLTICEECKKEVSNRASTCPHCGYPLHRRRQIAEAKAVVETAKQRIAHGRSVMRTPIRKLGVGIGKVAILTITVLALAAVYYLVMTVGQMSITTRTVVNLFLPAFWIPILTMTQRLYGQKGRNIAFIVFLVIVPFSILGECEQMRDATIFDRISNRDAVLPVVAKCVGIIWVIGILRVRRKPEMTASDKGRESNDRPQNAKDTSLAQGTELLDNAHVLENTTPTIANAKNRTAVPIACALCLLGTVIAGILWHEDLELMFEDNTAYKPPTTFLGYKVGGMVEDGTNVIKTVSPPEGASGFSVGCFIERDRGRVRRGGRIRLF